MLYSTVRTVLLLLLYCCTRTVVPVCTVLYLVARYQYITCTSMYGKLSTTSIELHHLGTTVVRMHVQYRSSNCMLEWTTEYLQYCPSTVTHVLPIYESVLVHTGCCFCKGQPAYVAVQQIGTLAYTHATSASFTHPHNANCV